MREWNLIEHLLTSDEVLSPLLRDSVLPMTDGSGQADAYLTARLPNNTSEYFLFLVEVKSLSTPQMVHQAISQIKKYVTERNDPDVFPMILVPFLSEKMLKELERHRSAALTSAATESSRSQTDSLFTGLAIKTFTLNLDL